MKRLKRGQVRFDRWGGVYLTLERIVLHEKVYWRCLVLHPQDPDAGGAGDRAGDTPEVQEMWLVEWTEPSSDTRLPWENASTGDAGKVKT